jgi:hypothetical protein
MEPARMRCGHLRWLLYRGLCRMHFGKSEPHEERMTAVFTLALLSGLWVLTSVILFAAVSGEPRPGLATAQAKVALVALFVVFYLAYRYWLFRDEELERISREMELGPAWLRRIEVPLAVAVIGVTFAAFIATAILLGPVHGVAHAPASRGRPVGNHGRIARGELVVDRSRQWNCAFRKQIQSMAGVGPGLGVALCTARGRRVGCRGDAEGVDLVLTEA